MRHVLRHAHGPHTHTHRQTHTCMHSAAIIHFHFGIGALLSSHLRPSVSYLVKELGYNVRKCEMKTLKDSWQTFVSQIYNNIQRVRLRSSAVSVNIQPLPESPLIIDQHHCMYAHSNHAQAQPRSLPLSHINAQTTIIHAFSICIYICPYL